MYRRIDIYSTTIASGETSTPALDLAGRVLCAIHMPATLTGATLKFQAAPTAAGTYADVKQADNGPLTIAQAAAGSVVVAMNDVNSNAIPLAHLAEGLRHVKLVSASAEGATRTFYFAVR